MKGNFDNTGRLVRFTLRRERVISAIWILSIALFSVGLAPALGEMFGGIEARANLIGMLDQPAMVAMVGPPYGHVEEEMERFAAVKHEYQTSFPQYNEYFADFMRQEEFDAFSASEEAWAGIMLRFDLHLAALEESDAYAVHMEGFEEYLAAIPFEFSFNNGALYSNFMLLWVALTVGIMNIFLIVRHTRGDEEKGRGEVVRSLPVGRLANLNAAMITAVIVNTALALIVGVGIGVMNIEGMDFIGSVVYGAALGVLGLFFAALTAVFCQLSSTSRGAAGYSILALGVIYMLRAAGDIGDNIEFLSYISPMGLIQRSEIFIENYLYPFVIVLLTAAALTLLAFYLNSIRDMDRGFIAAKPGRKNASPLLRTHFGLSLRLLRTTIIAWFAGIFVIGASYGSVLGTEDFDGFVETSEFYGQLIGSSPDYTTTEMFVSMIGFIMAFMAAVPVLMISLKLRGEEKDGRVEHLLSRAVSRTGLMTGYVIIAFVVSILMQLATVFGVYSAAYAVLADSPDINLSFGYLIEANFVYLPALWFLMGLTVLLAGLLPKATAAVWGYYGLAFFLVFMGRLPDLLPEWLLKITPFYFIPQLPVEEINYATLALITALSAVMVIIGVIAYRKRDMQS